MCSCFSGRIVRIVILLDCNFIKRWAVGTPCVRKGVFYMVTFEAINMLFQFGIFLATALTGVLAIIALVTNRKKK